MTLLLISLMLSSGVQAARVDAVIHLNNEPFSLPGAVIYFEPDVPSLDKRERSSITISQQGSQFRPYISVINKGTAVQFPNRDVTAHHVYSFSAPKTFELPLYKQQQPEPVVFDKPGVVVIGCNIHDWMLAYLLVVDTPYFAQTDSSSAILENLPQGDYTAYLWHPDLKRPISQKMQVNSGQHSVVFDITRRPKIYPQPEVPEDRFDSEHEY